MEQQHTDEKYQILSKAVRGFILIQNPIKQMTIAVSLPPMPAKGFIPKRPVCALYL